MTPIEIERPACTCEACTVAGVSTKPQRRDWLTGELLHGKPLADWYRARDAFRAQWKLTKPKGMA